MKIFILDCTFGADESLCEVLSESLIANTTLVDVSLHITNSGWNEDAGLCLGSYLRQARFLKRMEFSSSGSGAGFDVSVIIGLEDNTSLKSFELLAGDDYLTPIASAIPSSLQQNRSLKKFVFVQIDSKYDWNFV